MKQILLSVVVILAVASLATVGTLASFSDIETSVGNYFATGNVNLTLADPDEDFGEDPLGESVQATWMLSDAIPGDMVTSYVTLKMIDGAGDYNVDITCHNQNIDAEGGTSEKDREMIITHMIYGSYLIIWGEENSFDDFWIGDMDGDGQISLDELEAQGIGGLPPPAVAGTPFTMNIKFDEDADNEHKGDRTIMTLTFTLLQ
jgi:predicted ribosomally synthesized peptide with SipW-like signal peptide